MRIAFLGKGGSGKTTISASFITFLKTKTNHVLAIDADVNMHLKNTLGMNGTIDTLSKYMPDILEYVRGKRTDLKNMEMIETTPPALNSRFIVPQASDPVIQRYALQEENISLLTVGTYEDKDVGNSCYHGKLGRLQVILHHMLDTNDEYVIVDATAGIDTLGTSLFLAYDLSIFVVEPTQKSIEVYLEYKKIAKKYDLPLSVVANKILDEEDKAFIRKFIPDEDILGYLPYSNHIKKLERGEKGELAAFVNEQSFIFEKILNKSKQMKKDWKKYYDLLLQTHKANALKWYNDFYNQPIDTQHDPEFTYEKALSKHRKINH